MHKHLNIIISAAFLFLNCLLYSNSTDSLFNSIIEESNKMESERKKINFLSEQQLTTIIEKKFDLAEKIDSYIQNNNQLEDDKKLQTSIIYRKVYAYTKIDFEEKRQEYYLNLLDFYNSQPNGIDKFYAGLKVISSHLYSSNNDSVIYYLFKIENEAKSLNPNNFENWDENIYNDNMMELYRLFYSYYQKINLLDKAIEYVITSHKYALLNQDTISINSGYKQIASLYFRTENFTKAKEYYNKQLKLLINIKGLERHLTGAYTGMGAVFINEEKYDSAEYMFNNALDVHKEMEGSMLYDYGSVAGVLMNLGVIHKKKKEYDKALAQYSKAFKLASQYSFMNSFYIQQLSQLNMSSLYYDKGDYNLAIKYSLDVINEEDKKYDRFNITAFEYLYKIYEKKNDYKNAMLYYKKYVNYKDSAFTENVDSKIESLEIALENERIKNENRMLEKERELSELKALRQNQLNMMTFIISFVLLFGVFGILLVNIKKRRAEKELHLQREENSKNEILTLMKSQEMQSMNSYMNGQEEERKRIASDLHDRLGSLFSTVKLYFSTLQSQFSNVDEKTTNTFKKVIGLIDQSVDEVRAVSHNLAKDVVVRFGLIKAIKDIEAAVNMSKAMKMKVIDNNFRFKFDKDSEMQLYKALQEIVTNSIRHSKAKNIIVQFTSSSENDANIIVEDDGIGIDKSKVKDGMGMKNIHNRLNDIGADYDIDTSAEAGTTFIINISNKPN